MQAAISRHEGETERRQSSYMRREAQMRHQIAELRRRNELLSSAAPAGITLPDMQCGPKRP